MTREKFKENGSDILVDMTRLRSRKSFLQVKALMTMSEKLNQVRHLHELQRDSTVHTRLKVVMRADNPYSLIAIFRRGYLAIKAGIAVYVTRCPPVELVPRSHKNYTQEVSVVFKGLRS